MPFKRKKTDKKPREKSEGLFKSIFIAYGILLLHLILLAALGLLVLFFRGVINYMTWIFLGGAVIILGSAYFFIKKIKEEQHTIREILLLPEFSNKDIEIKLLGGAASFKVGNKTQGDEAISIPGAQPLQLENPAGSRIQNLGELSRLYQEKMITREEYEKLKSELLGTESYPDPQPSGETIVEVEHIIKKDSSVNGSKDE